MKNSLLFCLSLLLLCSVCWAEEADADPHENAASKDCRFIWRVLWTEDVAKAQAFYGALCAWTFNAEEGDPGRLLIQLDDVPIAHMRAIPEESDPARQAKGWLSYCRITDVEASLETASEAHARQVQEQEADSYLGRNALIRDPHAALLGICMGGDALPEEAANGFGSFCWEELSTHTYRQSRKFYQKIFPAWSMQETPMGPDAKYTLISAGKGKGQAAFAGIMAYKKGTPAPTQWVPYILVENVEKSLAKIRDELGGGVIVPVIALPHGSFAVLHDDQGAVFYIWQNPTAPEETGEDF